MAANGTSWALRQVAKRMSSTQKIVQSDEKIHIVIENAVDTNDSTFFPDRVARDYESKQGVSSVVCYIDEDGFPTWDNTAKNAPHTVTKLHRFLQDDGKTMVMTMLLKSPNGSADVTCRRVFRKQA